MPRPERIACRSWATAALPYAFAAAPELARARRDRVHEVPRALLQGRAVDRVGGPRPALVHDDQVVRGAQRAEQRQVRARGSDRAVARAALERDDGLGGFRVRVGVEVDAEPDLQPAAAAVGQAPVERNADRAAERAAGVAGVDDRMGGERRRGGPRARRPPARATRPPAAWRRSPAPQACVPPLPCAFASPPATPGRPERRPYTRRRGSLYGRSSEGGSARWSSDGAEPGPSSSPCLVRRRFSRDIAEGFPSDSSSSGSSRVSSVSTTSWRRM